jgi:hypothetical protein
LLAVMACETPRYGAYLDITSDVEIDEVELYFGKPVDSSGPGGADSFATPALGKQAGTVFGRRFDAADVVTLARTKHTTYYLPATDTNQALGAYVVVVGLSQGQPVGIAEYFDFAVPSDAVHQYTLPLEPYAQQRVERWGERPGCIAWKRVRGTSETIAAVVRDTDRDCDAMGVDDDCDDLCSAGSGTCGEGETFCATTTACAVGCMRSGVCAPALCLPPITCRSPCTALGSFDSRIECGALQNPDTHFEVYVDRTATSQICADKIAIKPGVPCTLPMIEVLDPAAAGDFVYSIAQDTNDPAQCVLTVTQSATAMLGDFENHHLLISLARANVGPRVTFIMGIQPTNNIGCTPTPYVFDPAGPDAIFDCGL